MPMHRMSCVFRLKHSIFVLFFMFCFLEFQVYIEFTLFLFAFE